MTVEEMGLGAIARISSQCVLMAYGEEYPQSTKHTQPTAVHSDN
jgi:hypothetical protein